MEMCALPRRRLRLFVVATLVGVYGIFGQSAPGGLRQSSIPEPECLCSKVMLRFRCLRQPPVYHFGETIRARLSLSTNGQLGYTALPDVRRGFFHEIIVAEPREDAIDPSTLDPRIRIGGSGGWSEDLDREIDVNEWIQFQRPGRYVLHVVLKHIVPLPVTEKSGKPWLDCELKSNAEPVEVLPRDTQWEAAELARIGTLLESEYTRFRGASALRYLNTPEAAAALARWYVGLSGEPVNSELAKGIFESRCAGIVQSELEKVLRSDTPFSSNVIGVLTSLEVRRQFINRPPPSDPKAAQTWSREHSEVFDSVKRKYSAVAAAAGHPVR